MQGDEHEELRKSGIADQQDAALKASIERLTADLEILLRDQELNRSLLEEIRGQLTVIRQVVDYILFVSPEGAKDENDLYPVTRWLSSRLDKIVTACEKHGTPASQPAFGEEQIAQLAREHSEFVRELEEFGSTIRRAVEHVGQRQQTGLSAIIDGQDKLLVKTEELTCELLAMRLDIQPKDRLSPYDDLDMQLDEIKRLIKQNELPPRAYENFFFGLVIFMLLVIIALLFWIRISV
jgi:hypothetical protein